MLYIKDSKFINIYVCVFYLKTNDFSRSSEGCRWRYYYVSDSNKCSYVWNGPNCVTVDHVDLLADESRGGGDKYSLRMIFTYNHLELDGDLKFFYPPKGERWNLLWSHRTHTLGSLYASRQTYIWGSTFSLQARIKTLHLRTRFSPFNSEECSKNEVGEVSEVN